MHYCYSWVIFVMSYSERFVIYVLLNDFLSSLLPDRTVINQKPHDMTVNASTDVVFKCNASTDQLEDHNLKYEWRKNGKLIDFQREGRLSMNVNDHSLIVTGAQVEDSAQYTCVASNGLDSDSVSAELKVKGELLCFHFHFLICFFTVSHFHSPNGSLPTPQMSLTHQWI